MEINHIFSDLSHLLYIIIVWRVAAKRTLLINPQLKLKKLHHQYLFWSSTKQHQPYQWMGFGFGSLTGVTLGQHTYPQPFETLCDHFTTLSGNKMKMFHLKYLPYLCLIRLRSWNLIYDVILELSSKVNDMWI